MELAPATIQALQIAKTAQRIPVQSGWGPGAVGIWTGVGILALSILYAIIKIAPKWRELGIGQRRDDIDDLRNRIESLEKKLDAANVKASDAERNTNEIKMQMVSLNAAFELVAGELAREHPDNPVLKQARRLVAHAAMGDLGMGELGRKLAELPGIIREQKASEAS